MIKTQSEIEKNVKLITENLRFVINTWELACYFKKTSTNLWVYFEVVQENHNFAINGLFLL